jgi:hypothetical protein
MRRVRAAERGSALLVALMVSAILLFLISGLFVFVRGERQRAVQVGRNVQRAGCAQAGLELARIYFANHVSQWNSYLKDPSHYNPVSGAWMSSTFYTSGTPPKCTSPCQAANLSIALNTGQWGTNAPYTELFYDLDGDGKKDVYIYIRDNQDEMVPAVNDWTKDNDQNVIVGAVCISSTLTPRLANGAVDSANLTAESLLSYNTPAKTYSGQSGAGASGTGNVN